MPNKKMSNIILRPKSLLYKYKYLLLMRYVFFAVLITKESTTRTRAMIK